MLPLQHYCKAAVPNFFFWGDHWPQFSLRKGTHHSISSAQLLFLHLKLTSHVLHMQNKLTAPVPCRCRVMLWALLAHCLPGDRQPPKKEAPRGRLAEQVTLCTSTENSAERLHPQSRRHWRTLMSEHGLGEPVRHRPRAFGAAAACTVSNTPSTSNTST